MGLLTIDSTEVQIVEADYQFGYQKALTEKLDACKGEFDENIINEIVLWKVNRYPQVDSTTTELINKIKPKSTKLDEELTREILKRLLDKEISKGFDIPMASAVLRFKCPKVYQIIDQRAYRFVYGENIKVPSSNEAKITLYLEYLQKLKDVCEKHNIAFELADRVFYMADKRLNKKYGLKY